MPESTHDVIQLIGTSNESWEKAAAHVDALLLRERGSHDARARPRGSAPIPLRKNRQ
jgi:hypothetical protein